MSSESGKAVYKDLLVWQKSMEFVHFLYIARGSIYETMTMLEIFKMRNWIDPQRFKSLEEKSTEIAKMLNGLISSIKT